MDRDALSNAKPRWLDLEHRPAPVQLRECVRYVESIIGAIADDKREPDVWEAKHLVYAIHAIVEHRYYGALTFAEMAVMAPEAHRPPRLLPDGPEAVQLVQIQDALEAVKSKLIPRG
jgi:hypothetical protein